jgi:hypothetical protein
LPEWTYDSPATMTSKMMTSLIATITAFNELEVRTPKHSRPDSSRTIAAAATS